MVTVIMMKTVDMSVMDLQPYRSMKAIAGIQISFLGILAFLGYLPWVIAIIFSVLIMYLYDESRM